MYNVVNLENQRPTVLQALANLSGSILDAKGRGIKVVKIIHGYGASGKGGAIKRALIPELQEYKKHQFILDFVPGENFGIFNEASQKIFAACPEIARDIDYNKNNPGITMILIDN